VPDGGEHRGFFNLKTLVLGGYGNFGARISRALAGDQSIELLVGGRHLHLAEALASQLGHGAQGIAIDHTAPELAQTLQKLGVELLIHTAGPFQDQATGVAQAAAQAGAHYIDLADGRRFVCDFPDAMHATFAAAGRTAICGASTVPALSSAVVNHLCHGWQRVDVIDTCIAPAQTAPRGIATLTAVLSYCGAAVSVWEARQWQSRLGWAQPSAVQFARMRPRLGALCDIPDLELFPRHYGVTRRVMFRAALEVGLAQRAFAVLAALRAWGVLRQPARWAGVLNAVAPVLDWLGSPLGGMVVRVEGLDAGGQAVRRAWHIAADNDHGPEIPCMAAVLLARRLGRGEIFPSGAFTSMGLLTLAEFAPEFARWGMVCDIVDEQALPSPLP
jgi:saccharopine dehydrogenase-like NADP-dependent oxidoreductase